LSPTDVFFRFPFPQARVAQCIYPQRIKFIYARLSLIPLQCFLLLERALSSVRRLTILQGKSTPRVCHPLNRELCGRFPDRRRRSGKPYERVLAGFRAVVVFFYLFMRFLIFSSRAVQSARAPSRDYFAVSGWTISVGTPPKSPSTSCSLHSNAPLQDGTLLCQSLAVSSSRLFSLWIQSLCHFRRLVRHNIMVSRLLLSSSASNVFFPPPSSSSLDFLPKTPAESPPPSIRKSLRRSRPHPPFSRGASPFDPVAKFRLFCFKTRTGVAGVGPQPTCPLSPRPFKPNVGSPHGFFPGSPNPKKVPSRTLALPVGFFWTPRGDPDHPLYHRAPSLLAPQSRNSPPPKALT